MKRLLLWLLASLLTLMLAIPLGLYMTVRSEAGSRALLNWAVPYSPVALDYAEVRGNLLEGMIFSDFELATESVQIQASSLDIAWQPQQLWLGTLSLQRVAIENLSINRVGSAGDGESVWPTLSLPFAVAIEDLSIVAAQLDGSELLQQLAFSGRLAGSSLDIEQLRLVRQTQQLTLSGELGLSGSYPLALQLSWSYLFRGQDWSGSADLVGNLESMQISHQLDSPYQVQSELNLQQDLPATPAGLSLAAITFEGQHRSQRLDLRDLMGDPGLITDVVVDTSGQVDAVDLAVQAQLDLPWAGTSQISAEGRYQPGQALVQRLQLDSERGQAIAMGSYDFDTQVISIPELSLSEVRLAEGINPLQAQLQLQLDIADGLQLEANIQEASLEQGSLRIVASGPMQYRNGQLVTQALRVASGNNLATLDGQLFPTPVLDWQLEAEQLGNILQELAGLEGMRVALSATGTLSGDYGDPLVTAEAQARDIEMPNLVVDFAQLSISHNGGRHRIEANVPSLLLGGRALSDLEIAGSVQQQSFEMQAGFAFGSLSVEAQASGVKQQYWQFALAQLDLTAPEPIGNWSLERNWQIAQTSAGWSINRGCWISGSDAGLCVAARVDENSPATLDLDLTDLPLNFLEYLVVSPLRIDGRLNGELRATREGEDFQVQANLRSEAGSFLVLGQERAPDPVGYQGLALEAQMQDQLLVASAAVEVGESGRIAAQGQVNFGFQEPQIDAQLSLDMDRLQWLEGVVTRIDTVRGDLELNLDLQGPLRNPSISATGTLTDGGFIVPQAGIELSNIELSAQAASGNRIAVSASAVSGGGRMDMSGYVNATELDQIAAQLQIGGENFQLMDRPDMRLAINPDLQIDLSPELLDISGNLDIQEARARVRALPDGGIKPSEDEIIVGDTQGSSSRRLQTRLDLRIGLGSQVEFQGFGLSTKLSGALDIEQEPGEPRRSFGSIELVDGEYSAYGRNLVVQRGRMIFQGEFDNPALDVDAEQSYPDYVVGIHLGGTAQEPTTTLYSSPVMSQSDVLAVLLTGQKLDTMSASEAPTLLDAATRLGIVGGASIAERIEESFGLTEFGVRNDNQNGQSIVAGTYLFPRLYVEWAQGLFEASSAVQLEYRVSNQLRLKARSGTSQSMDLIYEIETD